jgi:hypothetical protein
VEAFLIPNQWFLPTIFPLFFYHCHYVAVGIQCQHGKDGHDKMRINLMKKGILIFLLLTVTGCTSRGVFPHSTGTQVDLSRNNYKLVKVNAIGVSRGFYLLGIIPIVPPTYTRAMSDLYSQAGITEGSAQALINVGVNATKVKKVS